MINPLYYTPHKPWEFFSEPGPRNKNTGGASGWCCSGDAGWAAGGDSKSRIEGWASLNVETMGYLTILTVVAKLL